MDNLKRIAREIRDAALALDLARAGLLASKRILGRQLAAGNAGPVDLDEVSEALADIEAAMLKLARKREV